MRLWFARDVWRCIIVFWLTDSMQVTDSEIVHRSWYVVRVLVSQSTWGNIDWTLRKRSRRKSCQLRDWAVCQWGAAAALAGMVAMVASKYAATSLTRHGHINYEKTQRPSNRNHAAKQFVLRRCCCELTYIIALQLHRVSLLHRSIRSSPRNDNDINCDVWFVSWQSPSWGVTDHCAVMFCPMCFASIIDTVVLFCRIFVNWTRMSGMWLCLISAEETRPPVGKLKPSVIWY